MSQIIQPTLFIVERIISDNIDDNIFVNIFSNWENKSEKEVGKDE